MQSHQLLLPLEVLLGHHLDLLWFIHTRTTTNSNSSNRVTSSTSSSGNISCTMTTVCL